MHWSIVVERGDMLAAAYVLLRVVYIGVYIGVYIAGLGAIRSTVWTLAFLVDIAILSAGR